VICGIIKMNVNITSDDEYTRRGSRQRQERMLFSFVGSFVRSFVHSFIHLCDLKSSEKRKMGYKKLMTDGGRRENNTYIW